MYAGDIYAHRLNRLDAATDCYRGCLSANPLFEEGRVALVMALGRQGLSSEMVAEADHLTDTARVGIGRPLVDAYRSVDHYEAANVLLQGCFDLDASDRSIFAELFDGLRRQGKHAQAVEAAERFLNAGGSCELHMLRELAAMSLNELGSQKRALQWLNRISATSLSS
jgi:tetratricopeptide (TPR) repeat protein